MMKKLYWLLMAVTLAGCAVAKKIDQQVNEQEVARIITTLAADDMEGRRAFTPGIDKAADFIAGEFAAIGLQQLDGVTGYRQTFQMMRPSPSGISATVNGVELAKEHVAVFSTQPTLTIHPASGYQVVYIKTESDYHQLMKQYNQPDKNTLFFIDTTLARQFNRMARYRGYMFARLYNTVAVLTSATVDSFAINIQQNITTHDAQNIVGILPGKSKPGEMVIFSGHYDHMGIGRPVNGDSIYNGANDDASGITAVIMAAKHYKAVNNNERTLVFAAFTAEEMGGYGSRYFSGQIDAGKVVAMMNIEMIGTESKWGKNSAYITGFEKTSLGKILQQNLQGSKFKFHPDPYPQQQLFYRSDNATLARLGVPAHTISSSKMDVEPHYHKVTDEVHTLDLQNMTAIIKAIITSAASIISGQETPTRVDPENL